MSTKIQHTNTRHCGNYPYLWRIENDPATQYEHCMETFQHLPSNELHMIAADPDVPQTWHQAAADTLCSRQQVCPLCGQSVTVGRHHIVPFGANPDDSYCESGTLQEDANSVVENVPR